MNRFILAVALAAASFPALAEQRWAGWITARVSIDAGGKVTGAELQDPTISRGMQKDMIQRLHAVEFEPAMLNGKPAPAEATVSVRLGVEKVPEGMIAVIDDIAIVVGWRKRRPPHYPPRELQRGITGVAQLSIKYDADGKVLSVRPAGAATPTDPFMRAALDAAEDWVIDPQRVAGQGVASTITVPVRFTVIGGDSLEEDGAGDLKFRDGGKLRVYLVDPPQDALADSRVQIRSFAAAQDPISDG